MYMNYTQNLRIEPQNNGSLWNIKSNITTGLTGMEIDSSKIYLKY